MQRITITIDDALVEEMDRLIKARGYQNRSEAVRDLVRAGLLATKSVANRSQECVASLTYVYDHHTRELPKKLAYAFQDHHNLCLAIMRVTLDHDSCLEVSALRGTTAQVEHFAETVMAERGVRHGRLTVLPAQIQTGRHTHGAGQAHVHEHIRVW
jgi:CopG family transcriptional regulator, nickel-responsive regulator